LSWEEKQYLDELELLRIQVASSLRLDSYPPVVFCSQESQPRSFLLELVIPS